MATFPKRRTIAIFTGATTLGLVAILFTNAHNAPLDEHGCHRDPPGSKYHCHTGPLKGKDFTSKEEAERTIASVRPTGAAGSDFAVSLEDTPAAARDKELGKEPQLPPPPPAPPTAVVNSNMLKVVSWNVKKRDKVDYDRIVSVLAEADIATLQDLDLDEKGKGPLHIIGDLIQSRIGEKICRMWFKNSAQGRENYGILWRTSTVGYVNESGEIKDTCGEMAVVIPTKKAKGERIVAASLFFSKVQKKMFQLGTVHFEARPGNPSRDIPNVFRALEGSNWPTIVTGDVKYPAHDLKNWNFKGALTSATVSAKKGRGSKTTTANIWTKNAVVVRGLHINLYDRFAEMSTKDIDGSVSNSFPMLAEVALVPEADDKLTTVIIKSKKEQTVKKESNKPKMVSEAKTKENFDEPREDIEEEANEAEGDKVRDPAAKPLPKKKKKKR